MRTFPRAVRRRVGVAALAVSLAAGVAAVPSALPTASAQLSSGVTAGDKLKDRQKRVKQELRHAHEDFEHSSKRLVAATQALEQSQASLKSARSHLYATRDKLADAQARDLEMQAELTQAEADLDFAELAVTAGTAAVGRQRDSVAALISDIYTQGDPDLLAFSSLLDAQTPADLLRSTEGQRVIVGTQTRMYDDLTAAELLLKVREGEVSTAKDTVADKAKAATEHVEVVQGLEADAEGAKNDVVQLVAERKAAKQESRNAKQHDRKQLRKKKKEDARIKHLLAERARKARLRALREARRNAGPPASSGGFLNRPVPGPVTSSYGMRVHPIYGYYGLHNGTDFGVACGEPMYSAADGRVVAEYYSSSYGNRLIIDNGFQRGVGLATIYNHASSYTVSVGDSVARGQVVGYVGNTGWSTGCHLHFTVTVNGNTVDPLGWL